jgi:pyridoxamine 5'-phosphate oxidase
MDMDNPRSEWSLKGLSEADLDPDPFRQFRAWYDLAVTVEQRLPDAMTLATATPDGKPSARMVLLKGFDERGFVFFTNYESRKGQELAANPYAALVFHWKALDRQVRIEGSVERIAPAESDAYYQSRPWGSRVSAYISPQSQVIGGRDVLEDKAQKVREQYPDEALPRPPYWGGYRLVPTWIEFWQNRPNRLHDRLCYRRLADGRWQIERLAP